MRLFSHYISVFGLDPSKLNITDFLSQRSIAQHAHFLQPYVTSDVTEQQQQRSDWQPLHRTEGKKIVICRDSQ